MNDTALVYVSCTCRARCLCLVCAQCLHACGSLQSPSPARYPLCLCLFVQRRVCVRVPHVGPFSLPRLDSEQLLDSLRLSLRPILLTRTGECEFEAQGRIGGDSRLTPVGHLYAEALARGLIQVR